MFPNVLVFLIYLVFTVCSYEQDFAEFLVDFMKSTENGVDVNIHFDSKNDVFLKKFTDILSANNFKTRSVINPDKFLYYSNLGPTTVNILNIGSHGSKEILKKAQKLGYLQKPHKWVIFVGASEMVPYDFYFRVDSKIYICERATNGYNISAIYKLNKEMEQYILNPIGIWNKNDGLLVIKPLSIYNERRNLRRMVFTLTYLFHSPITYSTLHNYRMTHIDSSLRFTYLITNILISIFNVEPKYIKQTSYGNQIQNTTEFTGIIGDLKSGRAVLGATPLFLVASRVPLLEYIAPNTGSYVSFFFKSPPLSYVSNIFVKPFDQYVWYSCFILTAVTLIIMYPILRWEWQEPYFKRQMKHFVYSSEPTISNVTMLQLGVISQQGSDTELKSCSGRIAMISALVAFMFIYTAYSANIVAMLQSTSNSIENMRDLLDSGIELGVEKQPYLIPFFRNVSDEIGKEMLQKRLKNKGEKFLMPLSEGVDIMRSRFFAFYTEGSSINKLMSDLFDEAEKCSVKRVEYIKIREPWLIAQKYGSYTELLRIGALWVRELGFYMAERKRIFYESPTCHTRISRFFSAGLIDTYPGFLFYGVGCTLTLMVLLAEFIVHKLKKNQFFKHLLNSQ